MQDKKNNLASCQLREEDQHCTVMSVKMPSL